MRQITVSIRLNRVVSGYHQVFARFVSHICFKLSGQTILKPLLLLPVKLSKIDFSNVALQLMLVTKQLCHALMMQRYIHFGLLVAMSIGMRNWKAH